VLNAPECYPQWRLCQSKENKKAALSDGFLNYLKRLALELLAATQHKGCSTQQAQRQH